MNGKEERSVEILTELLGLTEEELREQGRKNEERRASYQRQLEEQSASISPESRARIKQDMLDEYKRVFGDD